MKCKSVFVTETFTSIQGESTWTGAPCFFVRLSGCNLRCRYCDSKHSFPRGRKTFVDSLAAQFAASPAAIAEITGGEPLLQPGFRALALAMQEAGKGRPVLVETNGSKSLSIIPDGVIAVMDVKCPDSDEVEAMDMGNLDKLRSYDEVKFVISSKRDFAWARRLVVKHDLARRCHAVLFSPVQEHVQGSQLASWVMESGLPVRVQIQMHRILGVM